VKIGVAGIPGAWSSERIASSLRDTGAESFVFDVGDVIHDLARGDVTWKGEHLTSLDGVVIKKLGDQGNAWSRLRLHPLRALEARGVRVFSSTDATDVAMDRYRMTMVLAAAGLPLPATFATESEPSLYATMDAMGDCILKPVYTSKGRGMVRFAIGQPSSAGASHVDTTQQRYLVQGFVQAPGRDIGATIVGGTFAGAFYRVAADGEWMTTTNRGGRYEPCDLSPRGVALAESAARAFDLDYTVVDLVECENDFLVYEVSAFGGFRGLIEATGIDASSLYAQHVVRTLEG